MTRKPTLIDGSKALWADEIEMLRGIQARMLARTETMSDAEGLRYEVKDLGRVIELVAHYAGVERWTP